MNRPQSVLTAAAVAVAGAVTLVAVSAPAQAADAPISATIQYECHSIFDGLDLAWNSFAVTVSSTTPSSVVPGQALPSRSVALALTPPAELATALYDIVRLRSIAGTADAALTLRSNGYNTAVPVGPLTGSRTVTSTDPWTLSLQGTAPAATVATTAAGQLAVLAPAAFSVAGSYTRASGASTALSLDCRAATWAGGVEQGAAPPTVPVDRTVGVVPVVGGTAGPGTDPQDPTFTVPTTVPPTSPATTPSPTTPSPTTPTDPTTGPTIPVPTTPGPAIPVPAGDVAAARDLAYQCYVTVAGLDLEWAPMRVVAASSVPGAPVVPGQDLPARPVSLTLAADSEVSAVFHDLVKGRAVAGASDNATFDLRSNGYTASVPTGRLASGSVPVTATELNLPLLGGVDALKVPSTAAGQVAVRAPAHFRVAGQVTTFSGAARDYSFDCRAAAFSAAEPTAPTVATPRSFAVVAVSGGTAAPGGDLEDPVFTVPTPSPRPPTDPTPVTTPTTFHTPVPTVPTVVSTTVPTPTRPTNHPPVAPKSLSVTTWRNLPVPFVIAATDRDRDWLTQRAKRVDPRAGAVVNLGPVFLFWPARGWVGTTTFSVVTSDGKGGTATTAVTLTVRK